MVAAAIVLWPSLHYLLLHLICVDAFILWIHLCNLWIIIYFQSESLTNGAIPNNIISWVAVDFLCCHVRWTNQITQWAYPKKQYPCTLWEIASRSDWVHKARMSGEHRRLLATHSCDYWHSYYHHSGSWWVGRMVKSTAMPVSEFGLGRLQCLWGEQHAGQGQY